MVEVIPAQRTSVTCGNCRLHHVWRKTPGRLRQRAPEHNDRRQSRGVVVDECRGTTSVSAPSAPTSAPCCR